MNTLRDSRHESWVLAAYPDPKTSRPLIGAGFSLDVQATEHPQNDPLNPHTFLEPSSAQLWQAAGLDSERLQAILDRYDRDLKAWKKKELSPQDQDSSVSTGGNRRRGYELIADFHYPGHPQRQGILP